MPLAFHFEVVNFRLEGLAYLDCSSGKINQHPAGIDHVDAETVGFKPGNDRVEVGLCQTKAFAELLRGQPVMEVWRTLCVELVNELLDGLLLLRRTLQLEQHVLHGKIVRHRAAIVRGPRLGMGIALESGPACFIDALRNSRAGMQAGFDLRTHGSRRDKSGEDKRGEEPQFSRHGSPFILKRKSPRNTSRSGERRPAKRDSASQRWEWTMAGSS